MSDIGRDGWPTADAVLRSERKELTAVKVENEQLRKALNRTDLLLCETLRQTEMFTGELLKQARDSREIIRRELERKP